MAGIETVKFPARAVIFKEGQQPDGVFFIVVGGVEVSKGEGAAKVTLAKLGVDAVFGEMALIDSQPRSATVTAIAPTECMKGSTANFSALIGKLDADVKNIMQSMVTVIRDKNKTKKTQMSPADTATLTALNQKSAQIKQQIMTNQAILAKIKQLDPFMNGVFNSLLKLLVA